jgi:hypothetical protein
MAVCLLRPTYVFNPTDDWFRVTLSSGKNTHVIPVIPPRSSRSIPDRMTSPTITNEQRLTPDEVQRFTPESAAAPVILEPIDVNISARWDGSITLNSEKADIQPVFSITSDKLLGGCGLPNDRRLVFQGTVNIRTHAVAAVVYVASSDLRVCEARQCSVASLSRDETTLTFAGQGVQPNPFSFTFSIPEEDPPAYPKFEAARMISGRFTMFLQDASYHHDLQFADTGLFTGTGSERATAYQSFGIAEPFMMIKKASNWVTYVGRLYIQGGGTDVAFEEVLARDSSSNDVQGPIMILQGEL